MMFNSNGNTAIKIIVLIISILLISILYPVDDLKVQGQGFSTSKNTKFFIHVINWNLVLINQTDEVVQIGEFSVKEVRSQIDTNYGDGDKVVEKNEVDNFIVGLELQIYDDLLLQYEKKKYIFPLYIDNRTGFINRTEVQLGKMEGHVNSTAPVIFTSRLYLDFNKTAITETNHHIQIIMGEVFDETQVYFKEIKIELPDNWEFRTSEDVLPPEFPDVFFEDDSLFNLTSDKYSVNPIIVNEILQQQPGLVCRKSSSTSNGQPPNGGTNEPDDDDKEDEPFLTLMEIGLIAVGVIIIVAIGGYIYYKRK